MPVVPLPNGAKSWDRVTLATCNWHSKFGAIEAFDVKRPHRLRAGNAKLERLLTPAYLYLHALKCLLEAKRYPDRSSVRRSPARSAPWPA
jgi:hypothetical protein